MVSNSPSLDPRSRRTRILLQDSLRNLVREHAFESITVLDIARLAGVNRGTFYLHYTDKYDLLSQTMQEVIEASANEYAQFLESGGRLSKDRAPELLVRMFERYSQNADLLRRLLGRHGDARFAAQLLEMLERTVCEAREKLEPAPGPGEPPMVITSHYLAAALLGLITWWLDHNQPYSAAAMAAWYWSLLWTPVMKPWPDVPANGP